MVRIKLVKGLMISGSRILAPGTILEHSRGQSLIAKGVAVAVAVPETDEDGPLDGEDAEGALEPAETVEGSADQGKGEELDGAGEGALRPGEIEAAFPDGVGAGEDAQGADGSQEPAAATSKPRGKGRGKKGAAADPAAE